MLDWIWSHIETVLSVVAFLVAGWKARKAGALNTFLTKTVNGLADPADKEAIKADAIKAGVQALLHRTVVNAGLSSKEKPAKKARKALQTLLPLLLGAVLLGGCASTSDAYRQSYIRFAETGRAIQPHLKAPADDSVKALYSSFNTQIETGLAAKDAK